MNRHGFRPRKWSDEAHSNESCFGMRLTSLLRFNQVFWWTETVTVPYVCTDTITLWSYFTRAAGGSTHEKNVRKKQRVVLGRCGWSSLVCGVGERGAPPCISVARAPTGTWISRGHGREEEKTMKTPLANATSSRRSNKRGSTHRQLTSWPKYWLIFFDFSSTSRWRFRRHFASCKSFHVFRVCPEATTI